MTASLAVALDVLAGFGRERVAPDAYLVGGALRDALLGRAVREVDLTAEDAPALAARLAQALGTRVVDLGSRTHPLYRVPLADGHLDVTQRAGTLEDDLARRDFTVNAFALPLDAIPLAGLTGPLAVIDLHGGRADLERHVLRAVSSSVFVDDPVRALRAGRLVATLRFTLDEVTAAALSAAAPHLAEVAPERVAAELQQLFEADRSADGVRALDAAGILDACFPELAEGRDIDQRPWHAYRVREHQLVAFERVDTLLAPAAPTEEDDAELWREFWERAEWPETRWGELRAHLDEHRAVLKVATLLHDIGKPRTLVVQPDGRTRFFGHAEVGAEMAASRLTAWRFPSAFVRRAALLIEEHLRPGQVMSPGELPTDRALYRFHRDLGDATPDLCLLFLADSLATEPETVRARWPAYVEHVRRIITWRPPGRAEEVRRLVTGREVMQATGLAPGAAVGRILAAIEEGAAAGEIASVDDALTLARRLARGGLPAGGGDTGGKR